ncbi:hypothetical protein F2981_14685 [Sinorhizobium meliloti]|nr:hypothetical protein [Sinorhizobium meliloti]
MCEAALSLVPVPLRRQSAALQHRHHFGRNMHPLPSIASKFQPFATLRRIVCDMRHAPAVILPIDFKG